MTTSLLSSIAISYELSRDATDHLALSARSVWSAALRAELESRFPACHVRVVTFWSSVDGSRYEISATTAEGRRVAGSKSFVGRTEVYGADADNDDTPYATLREIADRISDADAAAWVRACEAVSA